MRLGISLSPQHDTAGEWAEKLHNMGCRSVAFPCNHDDSKVDDYVQACHDYDLLIAEVKAWSNPMHSDSKERAKNVKYCQEQLRLADEIGAKCCVNIAGSCGEIWDGGYVENYSGDTRKKIIETTQEIIDAVNPTRSFYTLEPMPWMLPDGPESYLKLLEDVDRSGFAVHMDIVNMINCPERYFFNTAFIEKCFDLLGPYIKSCHVKDIRLETFLTFNLKETACGDGNLDIIKYGQCVDELDPDMAFIIEHLNTEEEYKDSLRYVKELLD